MYNFIQKCLAGDALPDEIDDYVDQWHDGDSNLPLHTYLGMSRDEYAAWVESAESLPYIVAAHKHNVDYKDVIAQSAAMAARSYSINTMPAIEKWLNKQEFDT